MVLIIQMVNVSRDYPTIVLVRFVFQECGKIVGYAGNSLNTSDTDR